MQEIIKIIITLAQQLGTKQQLARELNAVIETFQDGIWITDKTGKTKQVNSAVERISGLKTGLVLGKNMNELIEKGLLDCSVALEVIKQKAPITLTQNFSTGKRAIVSGFPIIDEEENISGVVTNLRELTEMNELKSQLQQTQWLMARYKEEHATSRCRKISAEQIVAKSKAMQDVLEIVCKVAPIKTNILLIGKAGVGKKTIAKLLHMSGSQNGSFKKINCQATPTGLLKTILFDHDSFVFNNNGTLFIEEVADLPLDIQEQLLGVLQMQEKTPPGAPEQKINNRIITATNKDLKKLITKGKFKKELYNILSSVTIPIPPLHKRKEDIPFLIQHYTRLFNNKHKHKKVFSFKTVELLVDYEWPDNVRELVNLVERLLITVENKIILPKHLPAYIFKNIGTKGTNKFKTLKEAVAELEFDLIKNAVNMYGSTYKAATILGVSQPTVVRKLHKYSKNTTATTNTSIIEES